MQLKNFMAISYNRTSIRPFEIIDYKNIDLLRKFITVQGKILPRRITKLSAKQQHQVMGSVQYALNFSSKFS